MKSNKQSRVKYLQAFLFSYGIIVIMFISGCNSNSEEVKSTQMSDNVSDPATRLEWFKEAKFGMFIHWGPYSQLAGEWNGRQVPVGENAEWVMKKLEIPASEYRNLAHDFNPVKFNAKEWVSLAKAAGMKYIVITAKHHDGFAMYKSEVSSYNIVDWTSFNRDPLKELSEACAEAGIKFCVYYSHREDWDHPGAYGNNWDYDNDWGDNLYDHDKFENYIEEKAKPQLKELLTNYGPLGLIWFDRGMYTPEQGLGFVNLVHALQPSTLLNGRVGNYGQEFIGDYQSMSDNGMPPGGIEEYWETPMTLNTTWGFSKFDTMWKSPEIVIQRLVEIVSRGGNYLLNIGPKGDGVIPEETVDIFNEVGPWVARNSESIYGTTSNPFGELDWGYCTLKGSKLFLFVKDWPASNVIELKGLNSKVSSSYLLIDKSIQLQVKQSDNNTVIALPSAPSDHPITVIVVETDSPPEVDPVLVNQDEDGKLELNYLTANTTGRTVTRFNRKGGFHISKWTVPEDAVDWKIKIDRPGKFRVSVDYASNKDWEGQLYEIAIGDFKISKAVVYTGDWYEYKKFPVGYVEFTKAGEYQVRMHPKESGKNYLMYLRSLTIEPVNTIKKSGWGAE